MAPCSTRRQGIDDDDDDDDDILITFVDINSSNGHKWVSLYLATVKIHRWKSTLKLSSMRVSNKEQKV